MSLVKQLVTLRFGEQEQQRGAKLRIPGQVANAQDVYQQKTGVYQQRNGKGSLSTTTDTGSISTAKGLGESGGSPVLQTNDTVFVRGASKWLNKGTLQPAMMTWSELSPGFGTRPTSVSTGGNTWTFIYNKSDHTYWYMVTEDATGNTIVPLSTTTLTESGSRYGWGRPVVANGFVWLLYQDNNTVIKAAKFNPASPTSAPTVTTYLTFASVNINGFDVMQTSTGYPLVFIYGTGAASSLSVSFLDYATGAVKASPGNVTISGAQTFGCILRGADGSGGALYIAYSTSIQALNSTTLALGTLDSLSIPSGGSTTSTVALCGYVAGNGDKVVFYSNFSNTVGPTLDIENAATYRMVKPSGAATATFFCRSRYSVTCPFKIGSSWYIVTGHDDTQNLQRAYYLQDAATGLIMARTLYQLGGDLCSRGGFTTTSPMTGLDYGWTTPDPVVSGTTAVFPALANLLGADYQVCSITADTSPSVGPIRTSPTMEARISGGWPMVASEDSPFCEAAPAMYPRLLTNVATTGTSWAAGNYNFVALYVSIDARGNMTRSTPSAPLTINSSGSTAFAMTIPTNRATNATSGQYIELYVTLPGGTDLFLYLTIKNDPTVDSIQIQPNPNLSRGELLYTSGNILSNIAPPPHRVALAWRNRLVATDTDVTGETWYSKELDSGTGMAWSDILVIRTPGRTRAAGVVDENYLALFQESSVWLVYGQGLSDAGSGSNFSTLQLQWSLGCRNPSSTVTGPQGCFFQAIDGGIYLVGRDMSVTYVGAGVDDHKSATVTAAVHVPKQRHIRFFLDSGKCLVLDYGNTESNPLGKWYVWTNHSAVAGTVAGDVCYHVGSDGVVWQEVSGQTYDNVSTPILPKIQMATISFAGILGHQRCYRGQMLGEYRGAHTIKITATPDLTGTPQNWSKALAAAPEEVEFRPDQQRLTALDVTIERTGTDTTDSFTFEGLAFEIGVKPGMRRVNVGQQM